jgi:hypothetical protein
LKLTLSRVKSLSNVLRDLEDVIPKRSLTDQQSTDLKDILHGCDNVLKDLDEILDNYEDLGSHGLGKKPKRFWKKMTWEPDDVKDLRSRLTSNVGLLDAFEGRLTL